MHIDYYVYFQLISLLIALLCHVRLKAYHLTNYIPLLYITCIIELSAGIVKQTSQVNYFIYNLYLLFSTPIQVLLFYRMLKPLSNGKVLMLSVSTLLLLFLVVNFYFLQGLETFNSYSLIFIMLFNIVCSSLVLLKTLLLEERQTNVFKEPYFWINSATLLFSLGTLVVLGLQQYIIINKIQIENKSVYRSIMPILNVILYSAYSYAFLLCQRTLPSPSSL